MAPRIIKSVYIYIYIANEFTRRQWKLEQFLALQVFNLTSKSWQKWWRRWSLFSKILSKWDWHRRWWWTTLSNSTIADKMSWDTSPKTGLFYVLLTSKGGKYSFSSPVPFMQCCADVRATYRKRKHPNFECRRPGRGADSFVLLSYPIWVQCLNNFVSDCSSNEARALSWDKVGHMMERALFCTRPKSSIRNWGNEARNTGIAWWQTELMQLV